MAPPVSLLLLSPSRLTVDTKTRIGQLLPHPSLHSPSTPMDSSHGCNTSLASDDGHRTNLQPHEFVSNNNNNKHEKNHLTTIYTQNAQGLWRRPRDADGNILVDKPPDLSKLEYLIDI